MGMKTLLVVDDEAGIRELIQLYMEERGYRVLMAEDGKRALELVRTTRPHLVLLDIEMPGESGYDVCRNIRALMSVPILFVSCRQEVHDKVKGFKLGADDFITKPFDFIELEARIEANLRRHREWSVTPLPGIIQYGELDIHFTAKRCYLRGELVQLSKKEMELLLLLAHRPNQIWSADQLHSHLWDLDADVGFETIKMHISNLRRKLEKDSANPEYIQTVRGFGYLFMG